MKPLQTAFSAWNGFNLKQAIFTVESDPPPVPETYVPKPGSVVSAQTDFAWGSVYDPSEPVAYSFQISTAKDFQHPIFEMKGLAVSKFTLTLKQALRPSRRFTSYYWRVRATDGAGNPGAWSTPVAFQVEPSNTLPVWAEVGLISLAVLMTLITLVRIGNGAKAAGKPPEKKS